MNVYDEYERQQVMISCCYAGVQLGFKHLALRHIINPPHEYFDALLARQIAIHILVAGFDVPRRRATEMLGRGREGIRNAMRTVDARLDEPLFERAYRRMRQHALNLYQYEIQKAEAA